MQNMKNKPLLLIVLIAIFLIGAGFILYKNTQAEKKPKELQKVKVQAGWLLNGEFANVCSAIINGYYKGEGLDVSLVPGGPSGASFIIATNAVAQSKGLTIGIDGDVIPLIRGKAKENENDKIKVKAFASFWNDNPFGFIVREDSGIKDFKDFVKIKPDGTKYRIGVTADSVIQQAIAKYNNVPVEEINLTTVGFDANPFINNQVDAIGAYWTTQAYPVEKAGIKYNFISSSKLPGWTQPSMVAIAKESTIKENPEVLRKWLLATIKGTEFVKSNPEEAARQITDPRCGGKDFVVEQEEWLIKKSLPLLDKNKIGWIYGDQISNFTKSYFDLNQIEVLPKLDELVDYSILNSIYEQNAK